MQKKTVTRFSKTQQYTQYTPRTNLKSEKLGPTHGFEYPRYIPTYTTYIILYMGYIMVLWDNMV